MLSKHSLTELYPQPSLYFLFGHKVSLDRPWDSLCSLVRPRSYDPASVIARIKGLSHKDPKKLVLSNISNSF